jgi:hypothetical protein
MKNLEKWNRLARVPVERLKTIQFGALKGKSDINPQWRYKAMTEVYGECGKGWNHRLSDVQIVDGANGEVLIFVEVKVWAGDKEFTGVGGDKIVTKDKNGLRSNDEAMKMAYTDALGTALKYVGVASEIYEGNFDGSKYVNPVAASGLAVKINEDQAIEIKNLVELSCADEQKFLSHAKAESINNILAADFERLKSNLQKKLEQKKQAENQ